ncbi:MAG: DUF1638 domain-containing protein [Planctomycetota bacterium]
MQKLKIIACGVFEQELETVADTSANRVDVHLLDAGLHAAPDQLRLRAQEAIDETAREGGYDAVCFAYGLCGRGTVGLVARDVPLVLPRAHDCIALFLGSGQAYREQFAEHPGTFYFTTGWYEKKAHPERMRIQAATRFDPSTHPHYEEFCQSYGADNARYIVEFLESWRRNYRRAALIDHGFATSEHEELTQALAAAADWDYEKLEGSLRLLDDLVCGRWDDERFLVVEPGEMVAATNDERIFAAVTAPEGMVGSTGVQQPDAAADSVEVGTFYYGSNGAGAAPEADVGLGIDAGGTYTDAVLYEFPTGRVLSKAKALTTHRHLVDGIAESLERLETGQFPRIGYVCISTTLATNAIVEGRGRPVGLLLMPYHPESARRIRTPLLRILRARMTIEGEPDAPVEEEEVLRAARELVAEGAEAFAVSGYGAVRNPDHETEVRDILRGEFGRPVVCGHELSGKLNFVARAHTAVLNARLIPLIDDLLDAVEHVLEAHGIDAPMFVVRGDGSVMQREAARLRAVETVLSGPAASAAGGLFLTGREQALVVDMGGTTTDIAALQGGRVSLTDEGAQVGEWRTSVTAADIQTSGLGGDSIVRPGERGEVEVGPERVVPLCLLAQDHPEVLEELREIDRRAASGAAEPTPAEFYVLDRWPAEGALSPQEERIIESLHGRPHSRSTLARDCGALAPELLKTGRLEKVGLLRRSAVTPTDALHVLGEYSEHETEAARLGLRALGRVLGLEQEGAARVVRQQVARRLAMALMRRELSIDAIADSPEGFDRFRELLELSLDRQEGDTFRLRWEQLRPVVGIGAPVAAYLPDACRLLGTRPIVPRYAEVANAVGAVVSKVVVRATVRVRPGRLGNYVFYAPDGRREFPALPAAVRAAREHVVELARSKASRFGTTEKQVRVDVSRRTGRLRDGSTQLLEVAIEGTLTGAPVRDH